VRTAFETRLEATRRVLRCLVLSSMVLLVSARVTSGCGWVRLRWVLKVSTDLHQQLQFTSWWNFDFVNRRKRQCLPSVHCRIHARTEESGMEEGEGEGKFLYLPCSKGSSMHNVGTMHRFTFPLHFFVGDEPEASRGSVISIP